VGGLFFWKLVFRTKRLLSALRIKNVQSATIVIASTVRPT